MAERFEANFRGRIGPAVADQTSIGLLSRVFEWSSEGIRIEVGQRHAELINDQLNLEESDRAGDTLGEGIKEGGCGIVPETRILIQSLYAAQGRQPVGQGLSVVPVGIVEVGRCGASSAC